MGTTDDKAAQVYRSAAAPIAQRVGVKVLTVQRVADADVTPYEAFVCGDKTNPASTFTWPGFATSDGRLFTAGNSPDGLSRFIRDVAPAHQAMDVARAIVRVYSMNGTNLIYQDYGQGFLLSDPKNPMTSGARFQAAIQKWQMAPAYTRTAAGALTELRFWTMFVGGMGRQIFYRVTLHVPAQGPVTSTLDRLDTLDGELTAVQPAR